MSYIAFEAEIDKGPIVLGVKADKLNYTFVYGRPGGEMQKACVASTQPISTEATTMSFTGTFFGLYATANGARSCNKAYFEWFDYKPL